MQRLVTPEWLDRLPAKDPLAQESRRDLERLNLVMGNARQMSAALRHLPCAGSPRRLAELGAGDGRFALRVANTLSTSWSGTNLVLLDLQGAVTPDTREEFRRLTWHLETVQSDVLHWLHQARPDGGGVMMANLFLHHFRESDLRRMFEGLSRQAEGFVAIEPRRSRWALACSRMVGCIGCCPVTRHDAPVSVRAGFRGHELSQLWPTNGDWVVSEGPVGLFGHRFVARRTRHL